MAKTKGGILAIQVNSQIKIAVENVQPVHADAAAKYIKENPEHYQAFIEQHMMYPLASRIKPLNQITAMQRLSKFLSAANNDVSVKVVAATVVEAIDVKQKQVYIIPARLPVTEIFASYLKHYQLRVAPFANAAAKIDNQYCIPHDDIETFFAMIEHGEELKLKVLWNHYCANILKLEACLKKISPEVQYLYCETELFLPCCEITNSFISLVPSIIMKDAANKTFARLI